MYRMVVVYGIGLAAGISIYLNLILMLLLQLINLFIFVISYREFEQQKAPLPLLAQNAIQAEMYQADMNGPMEIELTKQTPAAEKLVSVKFASKEVTEQSFQKRSFENKPFQSFQQQSFQQQEEPQLGRTVYYSIENNKGNSRIDQVNLEEFYSDSNYDEENSYDNGNILDVQQRAMSSNLINEVCRVDILHKFQRVQFELILGRDLQQCWIDILSQQEKQGFCETFVELQKRIYIMKGQGHSVDSWERLQTLSKDRCFSFFQKGSRKRIKETIEIINQTLSYQ